MEEEDGLGQNQRPRPPCIEAMIQAARENDRYAVADLIAVVEEEAMRINRRRFQGPLAQNVFDIAASEAASRVLKWIQGPQGPTLQSFWGLVRTVACNTCTSHVNRENRERERSGRDIQDKEERLGRLPTPTAELRMEELESLLTDLCCTQQECEQIRAIVARMNDPCCDEEEWKPDNQELLDELRKKLRKRRNKKKSV